MAALGVDTIATPHVHFIILVCSLYILRKHMTCHDIKSCNNVIAVCIPIS